MNTLCLKRTVALTLAFVILSASYTLAASLRLRLAYTAISPTQSIAWIAQEQGLFKKNGLAAELVYTRGGGMTIQTLLAGEVQGAQVGGAAALSAMLKGAEIAFVALLVPNFYYEFITSPEIEKISDLKGKQVGVSGFGNITHIATVLLLNKHGIVPNKEVAIIRVGGLPEATAALLSGGIQGAILPAPFNIQAVKAGARRLMAMKDQNIVFPVNTVVVRRGDLQRNRNTYVGMLKAFLEAIRFLKNDKDGTIEVIKKYIRRTDKSSLELAYEEALNTAEYPYVHEDVIQNGLQLIASFNNIPKVPPASSVIDNSILTEARKVLGIEVK